MNIDAFKAIPYNQRLFRGPASYFHQLRYTWLRQRIQTLGYKSISIVELGCYDAKTIKLLEDSGIHVTRYLGMDANWEKGLEIGRAKWAGRPGVELRLCQHPHEIRSDRTYDVAVCLETFEHLPPDEVPQFIESLATLSKRLLVTVPVERGIVFLAKHATKELLRKGGGEQYSAADWLNSALSRLDRVERYQHKGFDERVLASQIRRCFKSVRLSYLPGLPIPHANFSAAIEAVHD